MHSDDRFDQYESGSKMDNMYTLGDRPVSGKDTNGIKTDGGFLPSPNSSKPSSAFEFSPEYRAWRNRNTVMGVKSYGRHGSYDGPRLTKLVDFLDACKVPILTFVFFLSMGLVTGSLEMAGIGTLGLFLFTLTYLLVRLFAPPSA